MAPDLDLGFAIRHIDDSFDPNDVEISCLRLLKEMSPDWKSVDRQKLDLKPFTDGITNTLIKVSRHNSQISSSEAGPDAVLIRAYGNGTDTMIDRTKELRVHQLLAAKALASPLLAKFNNGFMYGFIPGQACAAEDFHNDEISQAIATRLGEWHGSLPISALTESKSSDVPTIWSNAQKWIDLLPADSKELRERNDMFRAELDWIHGVVKTSPGYDEQDLVFSHTDLLCGNVIIEGPAEPIKKERSVTFIDYEYATGAPKFFDVANVFAEWAGPDGELSFMPSQTQRLHFIKHYVNSLQSNMEDHAGNVNQEQAVELLHDQVNLFRGLPGFYWGIWGLIQASISDIDFDYVSYAERRHSEYWAWKAEYDGSRVRKGEEPTVREKAWGRR